VAREVYVPMAQVIAVYARENGQGMAFEVPRAMSSPSAPPAEPAVAVAVDAAPAAEPPAPPKPSPERPKLTRIK